MVQKLMLLDENLQLIFFVVNWNIRLNGVSPHNYSHAKLLRLLVPVLQLARSTKS
jgi:hypothetical protein